jgi:hypothetical protein
MPKAPAKKAPAKKTASAPKPVVKPVTGSIVKLRVPYTPALLNTMAQRLGRKKMLRRELQEHLMEYITQYLQRAETASVLSTAETETASVPVTAEAELDELM